MSWWYRPYVPVAERRRKALVQMEKLRKKGEAVSPVRIEGRQIARTFWGQSWCRHLEKFTDYSNRLPRGRTYLRNGSVCHLAVSKGAIHAKVMGSFLYEVKVRVKPLPAERWKAVKARCQGQVTSLLDLLRGRLSDHVMGAVTDRDRGLFPSPREISLDCSCPDWAEMCKHVAGVLYGVGARLDEKPELLFLLRGVDHEELVGSAQAAGAIAKGAKGGKHKKLAEGGLAEVFGIDLAPARVLPRRPEHTRKGAAVSRRPKPRRTRRRTQHAFKPAFRGIIIAWKLAETPPLPLRQPQEIQEVLSAERGAAANSRRSVHRG